MWRWERPECTHLCSPRAAKNNFCIGKTQSQNDIINFAAPDWSNHGIRAATEKIYKSVLALTISSRGEKIKTHWANSRRPPAGMLALHVWITRRCDDAGLVCSRKHGPENIWMSHRRKRKSNDNHTDKMTGPVMAPQVRPVVGAVACWHGMYFLQFPWIAEFFAKLHVCAPRPGAC